VTHDERTLMVETDVSAQIGVNAVIGQRTQQDDKGQDSDQQRSPEKHDRVDEVEAAKLPKKPLAGRRFEAILSRAGDGTQLEAQPSAFALASGRGTSRAIRPGHLDGLLLGHFKAYQAG
jgi:hypothetical protein